MCIWEHIYYKIFHLGIYVLYIPKFMYCIFRVLVFGDEAFGR